MPENMLNQILPYLWLVVMLAAGALGIVALFHIVDEIERRGQPKPRGRRP